MSVPTMEDVARRLRLSRRTVSRVLKDDPHVAPAVRERVRRYLARTRFVPHAQAANLAARRVNTLGFILPATIARSMDGFVIEIVKGAFRAAHERGHHLLFHAVDHLDPEAASALVRGRSAGGLLVSFFGLEDFDALRSLRSEGIPLALVNMMCPGVDSFDCDNVEGGRLAARHLLESGRKRIAFIHGDPNWLSSRDRHAGYLRALAEAGLAADPGLVACGYYEADAGERAAAGLLDRGPDAIFCANDVMALGALRAIRARGLRVPEDVAVVGYDDVLEWPRLLGTPLTSVAQPLADIAGAAAGRLLDLMAADALPEPVQRLFPPRLVVRGTSGGTPSP